MTRMMLESSLSKTSFKWGVQGKERLKDDSENWTPSRLFNNLAITLMWTHIKDCKNWVGTINLNYELVIVMERMG